jgi:hypothetical protein
MGRLCLLPAVLLAACNLDTTLSPPDTGSPADSSSPGIADAAVGPDAAARPDAASDAALPADASSADAAAEVDAGPPRADFFVSPAGADLASCGALANPCKTVPFTQTLVRAAVAKAPGREIVVMLRGNAGPFWMSGMLTFGPADSTAATPVTWAAFPGEAPVISGGFKVGSKWMAQAQAGGKVWATPLDQSTVDFGQLFIDGVRHYTPRAPSAKPSGYLYNVGPVCLAATDPTFDAATCKQPTGTEKVICNDVAKPFECFDRFQFTAGDISGTWRNLTVNGTHPIIIDDFEDWTVSKLRLASVSGDVAYLAGPTSLEGQFHGFLAGHRYLAENVPDFLTSRSGNWYADESVAPWTLSYFTTEGDDPNTRTVVVPQQTSLLATTGPVQHLTLRGLTFSHDNWTVPAVGYPSIQADPQISAAVSFVDASQVTIERCVFANIGGYALELKGSGSVAGAGGNKVLDSGFWDIGAGGLRVGMPSSPKVTDAQETGNNTVRNNVLAGVGRIAPGAPLLFVGNSDNNTVEHNELYDGYGDGISICVPNASMSCVEYGNLIKLNHVHHIKQGVTSDGGGIYIFSHNQAHTEAPDVIENNWVHDVTGDPGPSGYGGEGIYLDNESVNVQVLSNLVYRASSRPLFINYGYGHTVTNNIIAFGTKGLVGRGFKVIATGPLTTPAFVARSNIFYWDKNTTAAASVPQCAGPWDCFQSSGSTCVSQFKFESNLYFSPGLAAPQFLVVPNSGQNATTVPFTGAGSWQVQYLEDVGSVFTDPLFNDPKCGSDDYGFRSTTAAASIGFKEFDYRSAGRTTTDLQPPTLAPAFPLQLPADPCTFY